MARDGLPFIGYSTAVSLIFVIAGYFTNNIYLYGIAGLFLVFALFCVFFFRDPNRKTTAPDNEIVSPGDGRIVSICEEEEDKFFNTRVRRISVFLSVFNVHINRIPIDGQIDYLSYRPGTFKSAFKESASQNERMEIGLTANNRKILFKQIAGLIARRVVCKLIEGQVVNKGDRCGLIKFGSRIDILIPLDVEVLVSKGQKVYGGITSIGRFIDAK